MNSRPLIDLRGVVKEYASPTETVTVLRGIDLTIESGQTLAIVGASGSGKSTLLHLLGALDTASRGEIFFQGKNLDALSGAEAAKLRNGEIGFVFQFHHLLPEFTTLENVAMPGLIGGLGQAEARNMAAVALSQVGLDERMQHRVTTLSGGERQRAAIARAILLGPKVLLADEPTGNLDEESGKKVARLLLSLNKDLGMTLVVVTHNMNLARTMGRQLELRGGELYALA
ncbi:MAG: ABC transporter ATP-binding protein [Desulfovibrionaceae bacterium]|nr:ABC transporter ATP-binding protein [Desulfovibrionaceae bacterium]